MAWFHRRNPDEEQLVVIGAEAAPLSDLYHLMMRAPWPVVLLAVAGSFLALNALFAVAYLLVGGISGARAGSYVDAFFFSVQTLGTIGYGAMYPTATAAHAVVTVESIVGILFVALTTGMVFTKFSIPRARMAFATHPVIAPFNGIPTLMFRIGNVRASRMFEATTRISLVRTERTVEGVTMYRMIDLLLERERTPALSRSFILRHAIAPGSPLHGATPETVRRDEVEFILTVSGIDEASSQTLHARHRYTEADLRWGARYVDMLSEDAGGRLVVDVRRFHEITPTEATADFPYPA